MRNIFAQAMLKVLKLRSEGKSREELAYRLLPAFFLEVINRYLRVEAEGLENIPRRGPVIVIANHSGYMAFDALMLGHQIHQKTKRLPRIIAHKLWFILPELSVPAKKLGLVPATLDNGFSILERGRVLILFPEGEEGNFKPSSRAYHLRRFRRGFVRLALRTGAPIVPAVVVGAEETHITLSQIRWAEQLGVIIPIPLNVVPLPARWHIKFGEPIYLEKDPKKAEDIDYVTHLSRKIRLQLQKQLHAELKKRKGVFL